MAEEESTNATRAVAFLLVALLAGTVALMVVHAFVQAYSKRIEAARQREEMLVGIVAARDLYQGITITEDDLFAVYIPPQYLHPDVYQSPDHVVGRIPRERILANEFIREERLADAHEGIGLNAIIPRGMRAISISVEGGAALSGFLNPGNYVDILVTLDPERSGGHITTSSTRTLLQAVYVLAVNDRMVIGEPIEDELQADMSPPKIRPSVTMAVTPEQAEQVAHAERYGTITLALRNDLDVAYANVEGADGKRVLDEKPPPVAGTTTRPATPRSPGEPAPTVEIIHGTKSEYQRLDDPR